MKQTQITITVVMPVYNVSPYVERCLLSVMRQTQPATECLIIDDASTDDSIDKCECLMANYDGPTRFTILRHDHNRGLSAARNTGTDAAACEYIYYLDSDDELTPDCLEKLAEPLQLDDSIEMVMGDYKVDNDAMPLSWKGRLLNHLPFFRRILQPRSNQWLDDTPRELRSNEEVRRWYYKRKTVIPVSVWNKLLRLDFIKEHHLYNQEGLLYEDIPWSYYLMRSLSHAVFVHSVTYLHHRRPGSICTGTAYEERLQHWGSIFEEFANNVVPGERIEETERYVRPFCHH